MAQSNPMNHSAMMSVQEVISQYDLSPEKAEEALQQVIALIPAPYTSKYAYHTAHFVCARLSRS